MGRWRALDLRVRLAVWYGAAVALAVLAYAGGVYVFVGRGFQEQLDRALRDDFELVERTLDRDGLAGITDRRRTIITRTAEPGRTVEMWSVAGELRARTPVACGRAAADPCRRQGMPRRRRIVRPSDAHRGRHAQRRTGHRS